MSRVQKALLHRVVRGDDDLGRTDALGSSLDLGIEGMMVSPALEMVSQHNTARIPFVDDDTAVSFLPGVIVVAIPPLVQVLEESSGVLLTSGDGLTGSSSAIEPPEIEDIKGCRWLLFLFSDLVVDIVVTRKEDGVDVVELAFLSDGEGVRIPLTLFLGLFLGILGASSDLNESTGLGAVFDIGGDGSLH